MESREENGKQVRVSIVGRGTFIFVPAPSPCWGSVKAKVTRLSSPAGCCLSFLARLSLTLESISIRVDHTLQKMHACREHSIYRFKNLTSADLSLQFFLKRNKNVSVDKLQQQSGGTDRSRLCFRPHLSLIISRTMPGSWFIRVGQDLLALKCCIQRKPVV